MGKLYWSKGRIWSIRKGMFQFSHHRQHRSVDFVERATHLALNNARFSLFPTSQELRCRRGRQCDANRCCRLPDRDLSDPDLLTSNMYLSHGE